MSQQLLFMRVMTYDVLLLVKVSDLLNDSSQFLLEIITVNLTNTFSKSMNFNSYDILNIDRLSNTWVTVSDEEDAKPNDDNICNVILNEVQDVVTVTCDYKNTNPPLRGRFVTIRRKENAPSRHLMNFCEVEVLSCPPGFWGKDSVSFRDCSQSCTNCGDETCRVSDGYCYGGCQGGYWGPNCNKPCNCQDCDRYTGCPTEGESESDKRNKCHSSYICCQFS